LKVALLIGPWSTLTHGPIDPHKLYIERALTGSESAAFNLARALSEQGTTVHVYCHTEREAIAFDGLSGASVLSIEQAIPESFDAYIALNEPDLLRKAPRGSLRICWEQLGDIPYHSETGFDMFVDYYVALSPRHRDYIIESSANLMRYTTPMKWLWIPNSINIEFFDKPSIIRKPYSMAWASSPDRGLHQLISLYPQIKAEIPEATLKIFYRMEPWYETVKDHVGPIGDRARYIHECLDMLGRRGENGITVMGPVANTKIAEELLATKVLPYTCDCTQFTETFSVTVLDACAAGCVPIISDADALGDVYQTIASIIPGKPGKDQKAWLDTIVKAMTDERWASAVTTRARAFAQAFKRQTVVKLWEALLAGRPDVPTNIEEYVERTRKPPVDNPLQIRPGENPLQVRPGMLRPAITNGTLSFDENGKPVLSQSQEISHTPGPPSPQALQAAPAPPPSTATPVSGPVANTTEQKQQKQFLRIAVIMGKLGADIHGKLNIQSIFESNENFVTGTVSGFVNIAWGLAERGNQVDAFCDARNRVIASTWGGANFYPVDEVTIDVTYDAYVCINEPDLLRNRPSDKLKICVVWLNDFNSSREGFDQHVDLYVVPSETLANRLSRMYNINQTKFRVIPLCVNPEFHQQTRPRRPGSIAYCSSPDRGLHHLLNLFPRIKERVPEANLRIYYRFKPWLKNVLDGDWSIGTEVRRRAESIKQSLNDLGSEGQYGVQLVDAIPPIQMARELNETMVLGYTYDPMIFTEGFSVAVLDACAAGVVPIVGGADALPEIYWNGAHIMYSKPAEKPEEWIETMVMALTDKDFASSIRTSAKALSRDYTRQRVARRWENLIREKIS